MIFTTFENSSTFDYFDDIATELMDENYPLYLTTDLIRVNYRDQDFTEVTIRQLNNALFQQSHTKAPYYDNIDVRRSRKMFQSRFLRVYTRNV